MLCFPTDTQISLQTTRGETLGSAESKLSLACKHLETEGFGWAGDSNTLPVFVGALRIFFLAADGP